MKKTKGLAPLAIAIGLTVIGLVASKLPISRSRKYRVACWVSRNI